MNQIQKDLRELADNVDHYKESLPDVIANLYHEASQARARGDYMRAGDLEEEADDVYLALCVIKELAELKQKGKL